MAKKGKKYRAAASKIEQKDYDLREALELLKSMDIAKFDETVEMAFRLGVDPRRADQMVRGTLMLPNGTGKTKRVLVIADGERQKQAEEAGADIVAGEEIVQKIQDGFLEFDAVIATPAMMRVVGRLGKVLGPRGLMPNPKTGTVTMDVANAVKEIKAGKVAYKVDKTGIVHAPIGKKSFGLDKLFANAEALANSVVKAKPPGAKGKYLKSVYVSATMSPGISIDTSSVSG
ncbi:50S ribosomal protein L1 [Acanthopleuribacter pedis]|uniref:Large ribosomal subunit protein uL1 n=1 Tax=Acanthopleuribacter pedis TaxID=442870 RepID=A0A8J7QCL2_9BACT|nr:50S ribosomal protein L1 [Acanthopleuribacter pedis]MBO1322017.1 50S ribosomal protein L1 [Acanthopleuribacter pedis]